MSGSLRSLFKYVAKSNGIAEDLDARDAVFPFGPGRTAKNVNRTGLYDKISPLPAVTGFQAQTESASGKKRDTDDVAEYRTVLMPPDGSPGRILGDENLLEFSRCDPSEPFRPCSDARKKTSECLQFSSVRRR